MVNRLNVVISDEASSFLLEFKKINSFKNLDDTVDKLILDRKNNENKKGGFDE